MIALLKWAIGCIIADLAPSPDRDEVTRLRQSVAELSEELATAEGVNVYQAQELGRNRTLIDSYREDQDEIREVLLSEKSDAAKLEHIDNVVNAIPF